MKTLEYFTNRRVCARHISHWNGIFEPYGSQTGLGQANMESEGAQEQYNSALESLVDWTPCAMTHCHAVI